MATQGIRSLLGAGVAMYAVAVASPVLAQTKSFNVPAQSAVTGIPELARQADVQILVIESAVRGKTTKAVHGNMSVAQALHRLLGGTGLRVSSNDGRTITLAPESAAAPSVGDARASSATGETAAATTGSEAIGADIVVTGTSIRGVKTLSVPTIVFTRSDIDATGVKTLGDLFARLPQNLGELKPGLFGASGLSQIGNQNYQAATAVSLRGLGPQSTLTLINGLRRAGNVNGRVVDISSIPLAIVDRVDVLTGADSAVYGSDAVAGVVNIITRHDFDGLETSVSYGGPTGAGGNRFEASAIGGINTPRTGFVIGYDYTRTTPFDVTKTNTPIIPSSAGYVPTRTYVIPDSRRNSVYVSGRTSPTDAFSFYVDGQYSKANTEYANEFTLPARQFTSKTRDDVVSEQYGATGGVKADIFADWKLDAAVSYSAVDNNEQQNGSSQIGASVSASKEGGETHFSTLLGRAVATGPLFELFGNELKAAVGAEWRREEQSGLSLQTGSTGALQSRTVSSAFFELHAPVGESGRLQLSAAGRYDSYSDIGHTFNPLGGFVWKPQDWITFRGNISRSFRAPDLFSKNNLSSSATLRPLADPQSSTGTSLVLVLQGDNPNLKPETATTWSLGFDVTPQFARWLKITASYYDIRYRNRIDTPVSGTAASAALQNPAYAELVSRTPSPSEANDFLRGSVFFNNNSGIAFDRTTQNLLTVFPGVILFDDRIANIAQDTVRGVDFSVSGKWRVGRNQLLADLSGTHYFNFSRRFLPLSPIVALDDQPGKPASTRLRGRLGWSEGSTSVDTFVNYVGSYQDPFVTPARHVDSWTTFDATFRADIGRLTSANFLKGTTLSLSVQNAFNSRPPKVYSNTLGLGYDGVNADPLGRVLSFQLSHKW
ncbi:MAG: hypothetical protein JWR80_7477 [Bradyrhizobium sp.]|nr:hypothetical protein [Bradyrhizobium sp.]